MTTYVDAYSRMPLSFNVSFDSPSRASVAAVLLDCVRRHSRLSDTVVVDQGPEFNSVMLESALADCRLDKLERPVAAARYGSVVERLFGTTNTAFIHELTGNTTALSLGRGLSSSHHPNRSAVWTLPSLDEALERWLFHVYSSRVHSTLGDTPRDVFDRSVALSGIRAARFLAYDYSLRMLLAQAPPRGDTRQVHPVRGIVIEHLPYWHDDFKYRDVAGTNVPVKIDVADCSSAYAYVRHRWVTCRLAAGDADLHGRSWRQIHLATDSLRQQRRVGRAARSLNAESIGRFLLDCDDQAIALQAARDAEARLRHNGDSTAPPSVSRQSVVAAGRPLPSPVSESPSVERSCSDTGPESSATAIDDQPDYDQLETFNAK